MNNQESQLVSLDEFWKVVGSHKHGYLINVGNEEGEDHTLELFCAYYAYAEYKTYEWIGFGNDLDKINKAQEIKTQPITNIGTLAFDVKGILSILDLNEIDRQYRFEIYCDKVYQLKLADGNDVYIGLMD